MEKKYFVLISEKPSGPFTLEDIRGLLTIGTINEETLYALDGGERWMPISVMRPLLEATRPPEKPIPWTSRVSKSTVYVALSVVVVTMAGVVAGPDAAGGMVGAILFFSIYFLPTIIATSRRHRNTPAISLLNLLLGWTVLGWIVALIWAVYRDKDSADGKPLTKSP